MDPSSSSSAASAAASSSSCPSSSILVMGTPQKSSQSPIHQESSSPIERLPEDSLQHIFSHLPLPQVAASRSVSRLFYSALSSAPFLALLPPLPLLVLRHPRHSPPNPPSLVAFDPSLNSWHRFPLSFLPFPSLSPITASPSLLYLWSDTTAADSNSRSTKTLVPCNPLTRTFRPLPPLGSAWSRHGTVLAGPSGCVLVLTELAALFYPPASRRWLKFSLNLPSKPRSPVLVGDSAYAICDVCSPWRSQWKLFACRLSDLGLPRGWDRLERPEWGEIFDILKRPRLLRGRGEGEILMVGGLRSSYVPDAPCSTVMILRLHLGRLEWGEAGKMPVDMYKCFGGTGLPLQQHHQQHQHVGNNKVKVFGGDGRIWFSGKKVKGKMVMWEDGEGEAAGKGGGWRWIEGAPGYGDGAYRGFVFSASLTTSP